ncbi:MAG: NosD domain-containing protein [Candidatus Zixiibacteriota bacterium]
MKKFFILCLLILTFLASNPPHARIIHVPADASTIQGGISGAVDGDTVLVAKGHYHERIDFLGKAILVASSFIFDEDTNTVDSTIIDANISVLGASDSGSVVFFVSGEDSSSCIVGFTIQNGRGLRLGELSYGGGIICFSSGPRILANKIVDNYAMFGGGICCIAGSSTPLIKANRLIDNHSEVGGAILIERSLPLIKDNLLVDNHALRKGGGIFFKLCTLTVVGNRVEGNTTDGFGGGVCGHSGSLTLEGNEIVRNTCVTKGGGLYCASLVPATISYNLFDGNIAENGGGIYTANCSSFITSNTVVRNSATGDGGGILIGGLGHDPVVVNNIVCLSTSGEGIWCRLDGTPFISFNDVWGNAFGNFHDCPAGVGDTSWGFNFNGTPCDSFHNIVADPLFADSIGFGLLCASPCIDAGDPNFSAPPDSGGCRIDMGAHEYSYVLGDANSDGSVTPKGAITIGDLVFVVNYLFRWGIEPCPCHAADTNCDGEVNVADIVCLVNYLYRGGDLPC